MPIHSPSRQQCRLLSLCCIAALILLLSNNGNNVSALIPTIRKSTLHTHTITPKQQSLHRSALFHRLPTSSSSITKTSKTASLVNFISRRRHHHQKTNKRTLLEQKAMLKEQEDRPSIAIKPRDTVQYDNDKDNTFTRPPTSPMTFEQEEEDQTVKKYSRWSKFKDGFYDTISNLSKLSQTSSRTKTRQENASVLRHPYQGYDDTILQGKTSTSITSSSPGQRLLSQYESIQREEDEIQEIIKEELKEDGAGEEEDYFRSKGRQRFDSFKDGVYFAMDKLSSSSPSSFTPKDKTSKGGAVVTSTTPIQKLLQEDDDEGKLINFKPVSKTSTRSTQLEKEIQSYIPLLKSSNPIKRYRAKLSIQSLERKLDSYRRYYEKEEEEEQNDSSKTKTKETFYNVYDNVGKSVKTLSKLPSIFIQTFQQTSDVTSDVFMDVSDTLSSIPPTLSKTATAVANLPTTVKEGTIQTKETIQQKADSIQKTTQETIEGTQRLVQDVKNIPQKVESNINQTKQSIQKTQQQVNDAIFDAKVVLGLEQPKPKPPPPPPPPPPPKPLSDLAYEVAWDATKLSGKITWNAICGVGSLAGKGMRMGLDAAIRNGKKSVAASSQGAKTASSSSSSSPARMNTPKRKAVTAAAAATITTSKKKETAQPAVATAGVDTSSTPPLPSIAEIDVDLGKEVEDALNLVEQTLEKEKQRKQQQQEQQQQQSSWNIFTSNKKEQEQSPYFTAATNEINEALRRAKEAANRATNDAAQLEIIAANDAIRRGGAKKKKKAATTTTLVTSRRDNGEDASNDLDSALKKAKEAADQATRDAELLESMLKQGR